MKTVKFRCLTEEKIQKESESNFKRMHGDLQIPEIDLRKIRVGLLLGSGEAVVPLWGLAGESKQLLTWEFDEDSVEAYFLNLNNSRELFSNGEGLKKHVRDLILESMHLWGDSSPYVLQEFDGITDFRVFIEDSDDCNSEGCVLASAFFPSDRRKSLDLYPVLFKQTREEQVETIIHELGHIKGLRHSFAQEEIGWPNALFGHDSPISIMNYGVNSKLTDIDKEDLKKLYQEVWDGMLERIGNMPVQLCYTRHTGHTGHTG